MNKNKHYLISDASRQVQVEAHVLRYWEDELGFRFREMNWGIGTIRSFISSCSVRSSS